MEGEKPTNRTFLNGAAVLAARPGAGAPPGGTGDAGTPAGQRRPKRFPGVDAANPAVSMVGGDESGASGSEVVPGVFSEGHWRAPMTPEQYAAAKKGSWRTWPQRLGKWRTR